MVTAGADSGSRSDPLAEDSSDAFYHLAPFFLMYMHLLHYFHQLLLYLYLVIFPQQYPDYANTFHCPWQFGWSLSSLPEILWKLKHKLFTHLKVRAPPPPHTHTQKQ